MSYALSTPVFQWTDGVNGGGMIRKGFMDEVGYKLILT